MTIFPALEQKHFSDEPERPIGPSCLCLYGHFYQPPREEAFTGVIPVEPGAGAFANFNELITEQCYRPNAEAGNFEHISFDLGPTLAAWLERAHPDVYWRIIAADRAHFKRYGVGNALAQAYNHTILPLATTREKWIQIQWGLQDFLHRFGRNAHGMWLAETAVDMETLDILAKSGVTYTVLAPWQAATPIDPTEPYIVRLPGGQSITVFFYVGPSGQVSFDDAITTDANDFAKHELARALNAEKRAEGSDQLIVIATDGELYVHHKPWRDKFLSHLVHHSASAHGITVCTLERYLLAHPATKEVELSVPSAWSCSHGVDRWCRGCSCTEGDGSWKGGLRHALSGLAERGIHLFELYAGEILKDPQEALCDYLLLRNGWIAPEVFWDRHAPGYHPAENQILLTERVKALLEAQYYQQLSFTSCGFFFEDLDRIEPANDIAYARRAISLYWQALGIDLQRDFLADLRRVSSWRTHRTGADLYLRLPSVPSGWLPPLLACDWPW